MAKKKNARYNTLGTCVFNAIENIQGHKNLFRHFLHYAIQGYRDYMFDINQEVRTVELTLLPSKKVELPDDYLKWTKVGRRRGDMIEIWINDEHLPNIHDLDSNGNEKPHTAVYSWKDVPIVDGVLYNLYNYQGGGYQDPGRMFGKKVLDNHVGYFKVSDCDIQFNPRLEIPPNQKIYLEYVADGLDPFEDTYVHPFAQRLIDLYIIKEHRANNPKIFSDASIQRAENRYMEEYEVVVSRLTEWDIDSIKEASLQGYSLTPNTL